MSHVYHRFESYDHRGVGSICVTENSSPLGGTPSHTAAAQGFHDEVMSLCSEPDGCLSDDTDISSEEERPPEQFASRREFLCFGYILGRAHLTIRQYEIMREVENSFSPYERWPSRRRSHQLRKKMLNSATPLRCEVTMRQLPVGKGKTSRELPDITVSCISFSVLINRDFGDPVTAALFHREAHAHAGTAERPVKLFQAVAAREPARSNFKKGCIRNEYM